MFLEEISTDVIVEVGGRRIKAHKCILSSRCQYFAAILSGGWVESAGNVISLQGYVLTPLNNDQNETLFKVLFSDLLPTNTPFYIFWFQVRVTMFVFYFQFFFHCRAFCIVSYIQWCKHNS